MQKENINIICPEDKDFPRLLKEIHTPPELLYYKGDISICDQNCLAIVGSRKITAYGKQVTTTITRELTINQLVIVSGLALGVDTFAHSACLEARGKTIAVLGTGINSNSIYPTTNRKLAEKIIEHGGLILSEFPLDAPPLRYHFPQRNRIVSGLSLGTLVIEAAQKSGALITARCALEQNRDVFAIPGNIFSDVSKGSNDLIKQGAQIITNSQEIIETLNLKQINIQKENKKILPENLNEEIIISHISHEATHIDEITRQTKLPAPTVSSTLIMMEMKGMIKNIGSMKYIKI